MDGKRHINFIDQNKLLDFENLTILVTFVLIFEGVYDELQKKYLKTLMFCVCEAIEGPMIEEYACKISYKSVHLLIGS